MHVLNLAYIFTALAAAGKNAVTTSPSGLFSTKNYEAEITNEDAVREEAVVVGGGPVGLAAALMLANAPHNYDVTIYEGSDGDTSTMNYDVSKAYLYHVNLRGQTFTTQFPSLQNKLAKHGVATTATVNRNQLMIVPADPNELLPNKKESTDDNDEKKKNSPEIKTDDEETKDKLSGYWIPRHVMVVILHEVIKEHNDQLQSSAGKITYVPGTRCLSVSPVVYDHAGDKRVHKILATFATKDTNDEKIQHEAKLLVGADGMNSKVRECLATDTESFQSWPGHKNSKFRVRKWTSPATALKLRALQLPAQFEIPVGDGTSIKSEGQTMISLRSMNTGPLNFIRFGLLPMKDNDAVRPANVIARPNHEVWKLTDGQSTREWFEKAFPRFPLQKMVSPEEWDRFSKADATSFPPCQYSPGLQTCSPDSESGIVLLGDASHAFPPDIGQGINAGFTDVVAFDRALRGVDLISGEEKANKVEPQSKPKLGKAMEEYERVRSPELKALIRHARFGAPYQYSQPLYVDRVGKFLWTMNVMMRLLLNKLSFGLIPQASIILVQNKDLTFRQIMRRADGTTWGLRLFSILALAKLFKFL